VTQGVRPAAHRARHRGAVLARLIDLVAPPACLACRAPADGAELCRACRSALPWLRDPCPRCALPRTAGRCDSCPARGAAFAAAWAPVAHAGPARDLVLALKLRGALPAVDVMAAQMAAGAPRAVLAPGAALVPVPGAAARTRRRGFDPAARLAAALAARTGLPVRPCLRREGSRAQVGRGRAERRLAPAVRLAAPAPAWAVVVDDVHTTGATLEACARALRAGGAGQVRAITYARTLASP
jgi:predicted amidophosphoribosyltransferase